MDKELQKNMLFVQLKILKELRQLNKTLTEGTYQPKIWTKDLDDVREAIALCGYNYI